MKNTGEETSYKMNYSYQEYYSNGQGFFLPNLAYSPSIDGLDEQKLYVAQRI